MLSTELWCNITPQCLRRTGTLHLWRIALWEGHPPSLELACTCLALFFFHVFVTNSGQRTLDVYGVHMHIHNNIPVAGRDHILFPFNIWWKLLKFEDLKRIARNEFSLVTVCPGNSKWDRCYLLTAMTVALSLQQFCVWMTLVIMQLFSD